jgi:hypothetical protein
LEIYDKILLEIIRSIIIQEMDPYLLVNGGVDEELSQDCICMYEASSELRLQIRKLTD